MRNTNGVWEVWILTPEGWERLFESRERAEALDAADFWPPGMVEVAFRQDIHGLFCPRFVQGASIHWNVGNAACTCGGKDR